MNLSSSAPWTDRDLTAAFAPHDPVCERVGLELEKFAVDAQTCPLAVDGERSVRTILEVLERRFRWRAEREGETIIALHRGGVIVSVEPGGQLELSTPPSVVLDAAFASERDHLRELAEITQGWGVTWHAAGVRPNAGLEQVGWIPKRRYQIMRDYLSRRGDLAHWMMKMTASLQVSVDYRDEKDAALKLGVAARLVPILTAICAASPITLGRPNGYQSYRSHIWSRTDPDRCGLPDCYFKTDFRFADYAEYALDIPLFFIERGGALLRTDGLTFRQFFNKGFDGHFPKKEDWDRHLTFLFPEVRLKNYIEIRCCDRLPDCQSFGVAALIKALLYCPQTLREAETLFRDISADAARQGLTEAARSGFRGQMAGRSLLDWAADTVRLGRKGLGRLTAVNRSSSLEDRWYSGLEQRVLVDRLTLADRMLSAFDQKIPLDELTLL